MGGKTVKFLMYTVHLNVMGQVNPEEADAFWKEFERVVKETPIPNDVVFVAGARTDLPSVFRITAYHDDNNRSWLKSTLENSLPDGKHDVAPGESIEVATIYAPKDIEIGKFCTFGDPLREREHSGPSQKQLERTLAGVRAVVDRFQAPMSRALELDPADPVHRTLMEMFSAAQSLLMSLDTKGEYIMPPNEIPSKGNSKLDGNGGN